MVKTVISADNIRKQNDYIIGTDTLPGVLNLDPGKYEEMMPRCFREKGEKVTPSVGTVLYK